ncbi:MAG: hypothetical protein ACK4GD_03720 [Sphingomonadaceae bacterium]
MIIHTFLGALVFGFLLTFACVIVAPKFGFVNNPNPIIRTHVAPVPYGGGATIFLAMAISLLLKDPGSLHADFLWVIAGAPLLLLGLIDDARPFNPVPKLLLQVLALGTALAISPVALDPWHLLLLFVLGLAVINGTNFLDVSDGVVGAILLGVAAGVALLGDMPIAAAASGAAIGFLLLNWAPAKIYLGDAGSHFVGFLILAMAAMLFERSDGGTAKLAIIVLVLAILPVIELVFVCLVRFRAGKSLLLGSPDHIPLQLQRRGIGRPAVAAMAGSAAFASSWAAINLI